MTDEKLERMYAGEDYYWGREPNAFALRVLEFLNPARREKSLKVVDLGAGEGRDAVFFAGHGLDVLAVDVAGNALKKAERLAREGGVRLRVRQGDVNTLALPGSFDLVYSIGAIQYLLPERREERFAHLRGRTVPGGLHALFAFVDHPDVPPAPDWGENEYLYDPGELPRYYAGWRLLYSRSFVFDDDSGGLPHRHAAEEYVFEKPQRYRA